jgi:hypothetical protein
MAAEVPTRANNAIVVINFRMMGSPELGLSTIAVKGKFDKASRFVQMLQRVGARAMPRAPYRAYRRAFHDCEKETAYRSR